MCVGTAVGTCVLIIAMGTEFFPVTMLVSTVQVARIRSIAPPIGEYGGIGGIMGNKRIGGHTKEYV